MCKFRWSSVQCHTAALLFYCATCIVMQVCGYTSPVHGRCTHSERLSDSPTTRSALRAAARKPNGRPTDDGGVSQYEIDQSKISSYDIRVRAARHQRGVHRSSRSFPGTACKPPRQGSPRTRRLPRAKREYDVAVLDLAVLQHKWKNKSTYTLTSNKTLREPRW